MSHLRPLSKIFFILVAALLVCFFAAPDTTLAEPVTLVKDGKPAVPIIAGSAADPVAELRSEIQRISGTELAEGKAGDKGVYVGLISDFDQATLKDVDLPDPKTLGDEGFVIKSHGDNLYLLGAKPLGVQHAVTTLLHHLGRRQFFPGETWEVVPSLETVKVDLDLTSSPDYRAQRRLWYGFGAYGSSKADLNQWVKRNRMGGPEPISTGHTWYGINREADFEKHPEWFALVEKDGKEVRQPSKPCYSHPDVIKQITDFTLRALEKGEQSVSLSAPDGLGFCQCDLCREVFQGGKPFEAHRTLFAERPDGVLVNITSETMFNAINQAAKAAKEKYPDATIGAYAYSAYSHPTSFKLEPNIYVQTTTAYRRTPLSLQEQLDAWGQQASQVGIREYWSVYQWDWDNPNPGKVTPARLKENLSFYHKNNVIAMNAEASNNWAPRGLGYYVSSQLLWDVEADTDEIVRDFYIKAFGEQAAPAMERYYARWYGPSVVVGLDPKSADIAPAPAGEQEDDSDELTGQTSIYNSKFLGATRDTVKAAMADLDEAVAKTEPDSPQRARANHLRMYMAYLYLRLKTWEAANSGDKDAIIEAVKNETTFGGQLTKTNMIHARPLIGKAFHRRFRGQMDILENVDAAKEWGEGWRVVGEPPTAEELNKLWQQAKADLGME